MLYRVLSLFLLGAALAVVLGAPLVAQEKAGKNTHEGTFVSAKGDDFTMEDKAGKEHKHTLALDGKVFSLDGKECKLNDLKKGERIRVTTKEGDVKTATKVEVLKTNKG
jgi:hypothetical protein